jgi:hypothetical protein
MAPPPAPASISARAPRVRRVLAPSPALGPRLPFDEGMNGLAVPGGPVGSLVNSAQSAAPQLSGAARAEQVLAALNRSRVVAECWSRSLRRNSAHVAESLHVRLDVSTNGRARAAVSDARDEQLAGCIERAASAVLYDPGAAIAVEQRLDLTPGS